MSFQKRPTDLFRWIFFCASLLPGLAGPLQAGDDKDKDLDGYFKPPMGMETLRKKDCDKVLETQCPKAAKDGEAGLSAGYECTQKFPEAFPPFCKEIYLNFAKQKHQYDSLCRSDVQKFCPWDVAKGKENAETEMKRQQACLCQPSSKLRKECQDLLKLDCKKKE